MTPRPDPPTRVQAAIALGANLGAREKTLASAVRALERTPGVVVLRRSRWHETAPVGGPPGQGPYLNGALLVETTLAARELLERLLEIEARHGRERDPAQRNAPRTLDLDLLFHGDQVVREEGLELPHPRLWERTFVLEPLTELVPDRTLPGRRMTLAARLEELREQACGKPD